MVELTGRFVPLMTAFTDDGAALSEVRLARTVRHFVNAYATGFVVGTDVGEFTTMSFSERKALLEIIIRDTQNTLPVLTNVSTLSTSASIDLTQHAARHGARAVVTMPPYYGTNSQSEIAGHLRSIATYGQLTVIVVDPLETLSMKTRQELANHPGLELAEPCRGWQFSATDSFVLRGLSVSLSDWFQDATPEILQRHSRAAVAKALLEDEGLDIGRPRMPALPLMASDFVRAA